VRGEIFIGLVGEYNGTSGGRLEMDRHRLEKRAFTNASFARRAVGLLAFGFFLLPAFGGSGQSSTPPPCSQKGGQKEKAQSPPAPEVKPKETSPQGSERLGQSLKLSESPAFREAPLTEGGRGGYSSAMSAPEPAPSSTTVEEKALEGLLLDLPRWRVGPRGLIERADRGGAWTAAPSGVAADLYAVSFSNRWVGWVAGAGGTILRTADGGTTWRRISFPSRADLVAVRAEDWNGAQATTRTGKIYVTTDSGALWLASPSPEARGSGARGGRRH
jgi:photosynthesis system II assembly factor YCF48-like protein